MRTNTIVITPDRHMYIHQLPEKYDAMLDELHEIARSMKIQTWGSTDLGKPYVIVCPAFSEKQADSYNPIATQLIFKNASGSIYGDVSIVWMDDREGRFTLAGLTDEEAFHICLELGWTYLSLMWEDDPDDASEDSTYESGSCFEDYCDSIYEDYDCSGYDDIDDFEFDEYDEYDDYEDYEDAECKDGDDCEDYPKPRSFG